MPPSTPGRPISPAARQRGRVEGVLNLSVFLAQIVAMVAAGMLIDSVGYFTFFYALGGIVMVVGLVAGSLLNDPPHRGDEEQRRSFWAEFAELFNLDTLRQNRSAVHPAALHHDHQHRHAGLVSLSDHLPEELHRRHQDGIQHHRRGGDGGQRHAGHPLWHPGRPLEQAPDDGHRHRHQQPGRHPALAGQTRCRCWR